MAAINLINVSVDIPIYDWASASIRKLVLGSTIGGRFAESHNHLVTNALKDISFEVQEGDRIGLIGTNGSGKTTLLRVLSGVYTPTSGSIDVDGRVSPLFDISLGMSNEATGIENIRMCGLLWGLTHREIDERFNAIVEFTELGSYLTMPVRTYSAGMRLRLGFAIATAREPEILLLDEVIGAGDAIFLEKAFARLQDFARRSSILIVASHSENSIHTLCNKAMWLHRGNLVEYGETDYVLAAYKKLREDPHAAIRLVQ
jgi:ABC-2 type transport system ATP-binding protein